MTPLRETPRQVSKLRLGIQILIRTVAPLVLALAVAGVIIGAMGVNPLQFYADVVSLGLGGSGWQQTLTLMAPLLLISLGLIVAFRTQLWNLGYNGTYLLAAAVVAGTAPGVMAALPGSRSPSCSRWRSRSEAPWATFLPFSRRSTAPTRSSRA